MDRTRTTHRSLRAAAVGLVPLVLLLTACGGASTPSAGGASPTGQAPGNGGQAFGQGGGGAGTGFPGASGLIAAVSPGTLQVQGTDAQTTVTYGSSTRFTQVVASTVADGDCVTVTGTPVSGDATAVTATSVRIEAKVNGSCPTLGRGPGNGNGNANGNGGGGFFGGPSGSPRPRPSGAPSGSGQLVRDFAFATGTVTGVSGSTVTVQGVLREPRGGASPSAQPTTSPSPTSLTVTLSSTTQVTATETATSKAAVVGMCATALGKADDRGDIAATSITVSRPSTDGCRAGAGGFGFGRGGGTGTGSGGGSGSGSGSSG